MIAKKADVEGLFYQICSRYQDTFFEIEVAEPVHSGNLLSDHRFKTLVNLMNTLVETFAIKTIDRVGLRVFYFSQLGDGGDSFDYFRRAFSDNIINVVENNLPQACDYGIAVDGGKSGEYQYHFRTGPSSSEEIGKYLKYVKSIAPTVNYVVDLDIYESNFDVALVDPKKWLISMAKIAHDTLSDCQGRLEEDFKGV